MLSTFNKARMASLPLAVAMAFGSTALVVGTLSYPQPAHALFGGGGCGDCAKESTQWAKWILQFGQMADQLSDMSANSFKMTESNFEQLTANLQKLQQLYAESRALAGNLANFDADFRAEYKDFDKYIESIGQNPGYTQDQYERWNNESMDSIRTAMLHAGNQISAMDDEDKIMKKLIDQSKTAEGRMKAIQTGNEIAAQQVQQLQKLRELMNAQMQVQGQYYAQSVERQTTSDAFDKNFNSVKVKRGDAGAF